MCLSSQLCGSGYYEKELKEVTEMETGCSLKTALLSLIGFSKKVEDDAAEKCPYKIEPNRVD